MDALIRYAQVAPSRVRLSEAPLSRSSPNGEAEVPQASAQDKFDAMREEIERQVRSELASEMQELYESARERGRTDGHAAGMDEAKGAAARELSRTLETLRATADGTLSAMELAHQAALSKLESSVGEVAFAAVCRLVGHKIASSELLLGLVERTCAELRADVMATARLHPRDVNALRELMQDQELRIRSLGLKVVPDDSLELGGCVIEAASGRYDGCLESQLRRLHAVLAESAATAEAGAKANPADPAQDTEG